MATDMTITVGALPTKDSGKDIRRATESGTPQPLKVVGSIPGNEPAAATLQPKAVEERSAAVSSEVLKGAVSQMQDFAQVLQRELQFDLDEDSGKTVVRVMDRQSGDLIRQIPSEEVLALAKHMQEAIDVASAKVDGKAGREQSVGLLMETSA
ncbi:MAG: flagellar protein FlaG [Gammaproteobacteria bacterium (ex Lamellibrachia satsuma)]|nr:MAG: flagellar protein FlaG [Gammaproteobacteria bacterium (ex Lamellibrachia satsuma)]